jgi:hypothetical protein
MSTLYTNAIQTTTGRSWNMHLQTKMVSYTTVYEYLSNTEADLPSPLGDGSANITPTVSTNRILVEYVMNCGTEVTWRANAFRLYYKITSGGSWTLVNGGGSVATFYCNTAGMSNPAVASFLMPALNTLSTIYFKLTHDGHDSGGELYLNQNNNTADTSNNNTCKVASTIMLFEVPQ